MRFTATTGVYEKFRRIYDDWLTFSHTMRVAGGICEGFFLSISVYLQYAIFLGIVDEKIVPFMLKHFISRLWYHLLYFIIFTDFLLSTCFRPFGATGTKFGSDWRRMVTSRWRWPCPRSSSPCPAPSWASSPCLSSTRPGCQSTKLRSTQSTRGDR